jgi:hypothetical protein
METQPILLGLQLFAPYFFGSDEQMLPAAATITLLLLGFHWWAMWSNSSSGWFYTAGIAPGMFKVLFNLLAILFALAILILVNLALLNDIMLLILRLILIGWAWKRGQNYIQAGMYEEQLILTFKIGFIALLFVLVFALRDLASNNTLLNDALLRDLPIFFLAGMLALSFSRLNTFKKEQERNPGSARRASTNTWFVVMTVTWIALVALSIALEGLPSNVLQTLFSPLWYLLGLLASLVLAALGFIANLFPTGSGASLPSIQGPQLPNQPEQQVPQQVIQHASNQAMFLKTPIEIILVVLILLIILLLILKSKKRVVSIDEEEEIRESLDRDAILRERRAERTARQKPSPLEPLEPSSARALYREFLIAMAEQDEQLQRRANETPDEYKKRLLDVARHLPAGEDQSAPPDLTVLNELTQAYTRERYGAQQLTSERQGYLRQWVPVLAQRLGRSSVMKSRPKF